MSFGNTLVEGYQLTLYQNDCVRYLFIAANDEVFANRELAVKHVGRLSALNPAYVMPLLRKTVIQLLNEVEYSIVSYVLVL